MNVTKVDFFSLDVEGLELDILKTIPWRKVYIAILSVEFRHADKAAQVEYMAQQGYNVYKELQYDFIFTKQSSFERNIASQMSNSTSWLEVNMKVHACVLCSCFTILLTSFNKDNIFNIIYKMIIVHDHCPTWGCNEVLQIIMIMMVNTYMYINMK